MKGKGERKRRKSPGTIWRGGSGPTAKRKRKLDEGEQSDCRKRRESQATTKRVSGRRKQDASWVRSEEGHRVCESKWAI